MPETVARIITGDPDAAGYFTAGEMVLLRRVAAARSPRWVSSMPEDFERPPDASAQIRAALGVFGATVNGDLAGIAADPARIAVLVDQLGGPLGWRHGMDWKRDRLTEGPPPRRRGPAGLGGAPRPTTSTSGSCGTWKTNAQRMAHAQAFRRLVLTGRSGFAVDIPAGRFTACPDAAAFIAYWVARKNRRRVFSLEGKENPMDHLAAALLERCKRSPDTDWAMIAQVWAQPEALQRLSDEDRGVLAGQWWRVMRDCSAELAGAWPQDADRLSMIVRRGMDSSTWNMMAQAYNAARAGWLNCTSLSGAGALTAPFLPGKVMRLMAADLAWWHRASGGDVDPDTKAWARLPFPWDVINGLAVCTRADVEAACAEAGVDPAARGWTAPHAPGDVAVFTPTPELVHGVAIGDPQWAGLLRRAGVFSGKAAGDAIRAAELRHAAEEAGVIEGSLPVYDPAGGYLGKT